MDTSERPLSSKKLNILSYEIFDTDFCKDVHFEASHVSFDSRGNFDIYAEQMRFYEIKSVVKIEFCQ